jgi:hypothetical protein
VDVFKVSVDKPSKLAVELYGRRLGSPIDSVIKITDRKGEVIALNDDYSLKEKHLHIDAQGIITHHADSSLVADIPGKGTYYVHVADVRGHGGRKYGYRLRISKPMPGFIVRATTPSTLVRYNDSVPLKVYAIRRDGYNGRIYLRVAGFGEKFRLSGGTIPEGATSSVMTLDVIAKGTGNSLDIQLEAYAEVDGKKITAPVKAAERVMQAFLFEHLVPVGNLVCTVRKEKWGVPPAVRRSSDPIRLKPGEKVTLQYDSNVRKDLDQYRVELVDPPVGIEVASKLRRIEKGIEFDIRATDKVKEPVSCNILAAVKREQMRKNKKSGKSKLVKWHVRYLSAIPIEVSGVRCQVSVFRCQVNKMLSDK